MLLATLAEHLTLIVIVMVLNGILAHVVVLLLTTVSVFAKGMNKLLRGQNMGDNKFNLFWNPIVVRGSSNFLPSLKPRFRFKTH